jgi:hypothetical protein
MDNNNLLFTRNTTTNIITAVNAVNGNTMISNTNNLKNLFDVNINNPLNNQALVYNSGTTKWENKTLSFDGSSLNDLLLSGPQETDFIKWNPTNGRFINRPLQSFSANISGKINDALFPNTLYGFNVLGLSNYIGTPTINIFENNITVNTDGVLTGFITNRVYLFTARLSLIPTSTGAGTLYLTIGSLTGSAYSASTVSLLSISNQTHEISVSVNFILPAPTTLPDGYTVKLSFSGAYTGITPNDTNFTLSIQEL